MAEGPLHLARVVPFTADMLGLRSRKAVNAQPRKFAAESQGGIINSQDERGRCSFGVAQLMSVRNVGR